jgi:hypothetical protein
VTVTGAADGALQLRPTLRDVPSQDAGELQLHDAFMGGIRHVAVSSGRVFTAGADNVVSGRNCLEKRLKPLDLVSLSMR